MSNCTGLILIVLGTLATLGLANYLVYISPGERERRERYRRWLNEPDTAPVDAPERDRVVVETERFYVNVPYDG